MTRLLMTVSAAVLAFVGIAASFAPQELVRWAGGAADQVSAVLVQVLGALALGFAMLNWMSRGNMLGGIYGRPLVVGNLLHFFAGAMALIKGGSGILLLALAGTYAVLAVGFGVLMFTSPLVGADRIPHR